MDTFPRLLNRIGGSSSLTAPDLDSGRSHAVPEDRVLAEEWQSVSGSPESADSWAPPSFNWRFALDISVVGTSILTPGIGGSASIGNHSLSARLAVDGVLLLRMGIGPCLTVF